ncbi:7bef2faa-62f0-46e3-82ff-dd36f49df509 [Sclerotinia trifoliorum]|uniref:7bef2faa-62f0-46e3-82ff-dd36f49df509 n=1 Tax=Sclerotinia trifoliorum TaxID=28548 RepID=A0A8H2ZMA1_9HELO|nr:7bef2faa-62f0-46e3-82ff-dd36f49df509 [Sclerotinia trifoliorum]
MHSVEWLSSFRAFELSIDSECSKALDDLQRGNLLLYQCTLTFFRAIYIFLTSAPQFPHDKLAYPSRCMRRKRRTTKQAGKAMKQCKLSQSYTNQSVITIQLADAAIIHSDSSSWLSNYPLRRAILNLQHTFLGFH